MIAVPPRVMTAPWQRRVGDGTMGFWAALHEVYGKIRVQHCWVHKTANVLNTLPKSIQPKAKAHLKVIWMAETKAAFYDFPAEHWKHIRTTNPIKITFATVRYRTTKTKGCLSRQTALAMTHQLMLSAKKKWRKLDGQSRLPEIIQGIKHQIKAA